MSTDSVIFCVNKKRFSASLESVSKRIEPFRKSDCNFAARIKTISDHCVAFGQKLWRKVAALGPTLMTRMFGGLIFLLIEQVFFV